MIILFSVVWNPWQEKASAMSDFSDDEYPSMLCVEAGHVASPVTIAAGGGYTGGQTVTAKL